MRGDGRVVRATSAQSARRRVAAQGGGLNLYDLDADLGRFDAVGDRVAAMMLLAVKAADPGSERTGVLAAACHLAARSAKAGFVKFQRQIVLFVDLIGRSGCGRAGAWDAACRLAAESAKADFAI